MANNYIVSTTVESWSHGLDSYITSTPCTANTESSWYSCLDTYLSTSSGSQYRRHIIFNDNSATGSSSNPIVMSRISANHVYTSDSGEMVDGMDSFRDTVDTYESSLQGSSGSPFGYSALYPQYEGYKVIAKELFRNLGLAILSVLVVVVLLVPDLGISCLIFLSIACTLIETAGMLHWWSLTTDSVTAVMLTVSVGISVDYAAHVGHAFQVHTGSAAERAALAMTEMGPCVWHGFVSTFLAIVVLAPSNSYVFQTFFKCLFLASTLGILNGLFCLPVFLTILGLGSPRQKDPQEYQPGIEINACKGSSTDVKANINTQ